MDIQPRLRDDPWTEEIDKTESARFRDQCVARILRRRVGGGYVFIHRTFLDHVARLDPATFALDDAQDAAEAA